MATIAETLGEIPVLQNDLETELASVAVFDRPFVEDLMNITSIYYLDLLAHASMDRLRRKNSNASDPFVQKYNQLLSQPEWSSQYLRWQSIGQLYAIWGVFEQFIVRQHGKVSKKNPNDVEVRHQTLLNTKGFKRAEAKKILSVFKGIRRTRNSLHNSGIYQQGSQTYSFEVGGTKYTLEPGKPVRPIRFMDVIRVMWDHYLELKGGN